MKIILTGGTVIEPVSFCATNSFDGALVFEVGDADITRLLEVASLMDDPALTAVITAAAEGSADTEYTGYTGYTKLQSIGFDGRRNVIMVFMAENEVK